MGPASGKIRCFDSQSYEIDHFLAACFLMHVRRASLGLGTMVNVGSVCVSL